MQYAYWYTPGRARMDGASRSGGSVAGDDSPDYLNRPDFRRRLEDEASSYRRKIETYKEAQKQQAELVSRLQAKTLWSEDVDRCRFCQCTLRFHDIQETLKIEVKESLKREVLQYKKRCAELEGHMADLESPSTVYTGGGVVGPPGSALEAAQQQLRELREEQFADLSSAVRAVHEERRKYDKLSQNYNALRQQLEEAHESNEALTNDLQKLSSDWEMMREEMLTKEEEWKEEEASFNDYYAQEHSRLLSLWRDVVAMKRQFSEMQSATHRDLLKMRSELGNTARDLAEASTGMTVRQSRFSAVEEESRQQVEEELSQLKESMTNLRAEKEKLAYELRTKDDKLQSLVKDCKNLEERCAVAETSIGEINRQHTELDLLQSALREIAHAVLQDAESRDPEPKHHVHLTPSQALPPRSPKRTPRAPTSPAFVESTISAVQAALNKYQLNIHEVQVKLAASKDQAATWKRQFETMEDSHKILESRLSELTAQTDSLKIQLNQMTQEKDMVSKSLEVARAEKHALDKTRLELNAMLDNTNDELEKERKSNTRYAKHIESLEDEKNFLHSEIDRLNKDSELRHSSILHKPDVVSRVRFAIPQSSIEKHNEVFQPGPPLEAYSSDKAVSGDFCEATGKQLSSSIGSDLVAQSLWEMNLRSEEDRCSRMKEEILEIREDLNKTYLAKELLEQQKLEMENLLTQMDKNRGDIELELEQVLLEKSDMHEALAKAESMGSSLEGEKKKLQDEIKRLAEDKTTLQSQVADQNNDLAAMRKELLQAEQLRLDLDSEKISIYEKCKFLEMEKEKLELELSQVTRDRSELSSQLSAAGRKRETLNEEISRIKQRLEQANETNSRINRSLEDLVKDCENKQVMLEANEKEIQRLQEQIASMRADKEALEATLFDSQANIENLDAKRIQLEKEQQELLVHQESLRGEVSKLKSDLENTEKRAQETKASLLAQSGSLEGEFKQTIANLKKKNEDNISKLNEEREQVRSSLEKKLQSVIESLTSEKDDEIHKLEERIAGLQQQIENVVQQHEEVLLRAESDKQQALLIAQQDLQAVVEKLEECKRDMDSEKLAHDRNRRDAAVRSEQDRASINSLRDSLNATNTKLEQLKIRGDEEKAALENRIAELVKERDSEMQHCEDLKLQLHLMEDKLDSVTSQLNETAHRLKDVENMRESLMKELTDVRRSLADSTFEKEKYSSSNKELREHVKRVEGQKREQGRSLEEALNKITALDEARRNLENERSRLQSLVRELDRNLIESKQQAGGTGEELTKAKDLINQKISDERQLQARIASLQEERDRAQHQAHQLSKQVLELENSLEATREEVARSRSKGDEEERRFREREEELLMRLEDSRGNERKLQDQSHNLEVCLADATQQIQELKARLGGSEGRVRALETTLQQLETSKREIEQKLSSVGSTLRRIAGIQMDGSVNLPYKLLSPTRRWSPVRMPQDHSDCGRESSRDVILDVDPDAVRKGVRTLMQQVAQIERERDDLKAHLMDYKKQLKSQHDEMNKTETKLKTTIVNLRQMQEEKGSLEVRLGQKSAALQSQKQAMQSKSNESQHLQEKLTALDMALKSANEEKVQCEEKLEKLRQSVNKCDLEKRSLQDELAKSEARATKLELQRMGMEGDIQRLQMMLQEKEATIQKLQERVESESATVAELEERCGSLKSTVDQLNQTLERASLSERELNKEISSLQRTLTDASATSMANADKLKSLQKAVYNAENEKRVALERLEAAQQNLAEVRRSYTVLKEAHSRLQGDLSANEVEKSALEAQLRMANWPNDNEELKRQANDLNMKIEGLQDKVRNLETEKRSLERKLHSARSKSYERGEKGSSREWLDCGDSVIGDRTIMGGSTNLLLEQENMELKARIRSLESELAKKEAELHRLRSQIEMSRSTTKEWTGDVERYRSAQLQAERLLDAREQSHRQQIMRLENQVKMLREQLNQEVKRRQMFVLRSGRTGREVQQLHNLLDNSLRNVSQDPAADTLENENRKLDSLNLLSSSSSAPIALPPPRTPRK
ncbi:hypothetical protein GE061_011587 [Apolygus lucorum]|uniref:Rootletin-like coiled-coil domain-containing protein n=1 Tax=Apolygus lucorum TaxID=248454 RepID=A0A8S9XXP9_APOLU|nr:hypothetical protein GE061_011587 [Apolygus lucorum]